MITMRYCRSINCKEWTAVLGDVDDTGGYGYVEVEVYGKSLHLPSNTAMNLKVLLKKSFIF